MKSILEKLPPTTKRVEMNTPPEINDRIHKKTIADLYKYRDADEEAVTERIRQLDREWNTERVFAANASTLVLLSTILGYKKSRYWFLLTGTVGYFLLQHAIQGWCPPLSVIRRRGVRTPEEIENEKLALRIMRGDFNKTTTNPFEILRTVEKK
ncbi:MAG TPA: YgaP-like transmembrane domain [Clostridiaceae bacterium]|nr:YgaP-like transmembrane domain [Clostridiaceae bacterium]